MNTNMTLTCSRLVMLSQCHQKKQNECRFKQVIIKIVDDNISINPVLVVSIFKIYKKTEITLQITIPLASMSRRSGKADIHNQQNRKETNSLEQTNQIFEEKNV